MVVAMLSLTESITAVIGSVMAFTTILSSRSTRAETSSRARLMGSKNRLGMALTPAIALLIGPSIELAILSTALSSELLIGSVIALPMASARRATAFWLVSDWVRLTEKPLTKFSTN